MPYVPTPFPEFDEDEWGYIAHLEYANEIYEAALESNVSMVLIAGVAEQESAWQPDVMYGTKDSDKGAQGTMQTMPITLGDIEKRMRETGQIEADETINPYDPRQSIRAGADYLRWLRDLFGNDLEMVLVGYNAGPQNAYDYGTDIIEGNIPWKETQDYLRKVPMHIFNLENANRPQTHAYTGTKDEYRSYNRIESPIEFPGERALKFENQKLGPTTTYQTPTWLRSPAERAEDVISYPPEYRGIGSQALLGGSALTTAIRPKEERRYGSVKKLAGMTMPPQVRTDV